MDNSIDLTANTIDTTANTTLDTSATESVVSGDVNNSNSRKRGNYFRLPGDDDTAQKHKVFLIELCLRLQVFNEKNSASRPSRCRSIIVKAYNKKWNRPGNPQMTPQWLRHNIGGWLKQARELDSQSDAAHKSGDPSKYTESIFKQSLRVLLEFYEKHQQYEQSRSLFTSSDIRGYFGSSNASNDQQRAEAYTERARQDGVAVVNSSGVTEYPEPEDEFSALEQELGLELGVFSEFMRSSDNDFLDFVRKLPDGEQTVTRMIQQSQTNVISLTCELSRIQKIQKLFDLEDDENQLNNIYEFLDEKLQRLTLFTLDLKKTITDSQNFMSGSKHSDEGHSF
ncbi:unnamed protein product [Ambrosiozyma monospora]|uniref:Unnamed protein product n=1 Tax=Ambrosiozyma monospora TaxID=43982 RepID=A0ACB5T7R6_AMBMO|nr:unnamed protein product [Ambrosiozyma monospora]